MSAFLRNNGIVLVLYLLFIGVASYFIFMYEKHAIHLYVNQYVGNRFFNAFFFWFTFLGDGWVAPFLILFLALVNARAGASALSAWLLAAIISSVLKHLVFDDAHRPQFIFEHYDKQHLNVVEGVHLNIHNSFPSGHSTQVFAVLMTMAFYARRHWYKVLFLLCAATTAFSRVYLSQHWLVDIVAGSIIGVAAAVLFYFIYFYRGRLLQADKPLLELFRRKKE